MRKPQPIVAGIVCLVVSAVLTACATFRATPVDPHSVGTLKPVIEDSDGGLVGMDPDSA